MGGIRDGSLFKMCLLQVVYRFCFKVCEGNFVRTMGMFVLVESGSTAL